MRSKAKRGSDRDPTEIDLVWLKRRGLLAALEAGDYGVDVLGAAVRLLPTADRPEFIVFTLQQRQPHLVSLLHAAQLEEHAD